jgi:hypothetical protein
MADQRIAAKARIVSEIAANLSAIAANKADLKYRLLAAYEALLLAKISVLQAKATQTELFIQRVIAMTPAIAQLKHEIVAQGYKIRGSDYQAPSDGSPKIMQLYVELKRVYELLKQKPADGVLKHDIEIALQLYEDKSVSEFMKQFRGAVQVYEELMHESRQEPANSA